MFTPNENEIISHEDRFRAEGYLDSSITFSMQGKHEKAIEDIKKAIEIYPCFAQAYNKLGDYQMKLDMVTEALESYRTSLDLNPSNQNTNFDMGRALSQLGRYDEALPFLKKAIKLKPDNAEAHGQMAFVYFMKNEYQLTIQCAKEAIKINPNNVMATFVCARAMKHMCADKDAIPLFRKVIKTYTEIGYIKSEFAEGHYYIGLSHFMIGELDKALEHLEKTIEYDGEPYYQHSFGMTYSDADAFSYLAEVQHALGKTAEASESIKKALELDPDSQRLIQVKAQLGI